MLDMGPRTAPRMLRLGPQTLFGQDGCAELQLRRRFSHDQPRDYQAVRRGDVRFEDVGQGCVERLTVVLALVESRQKVEASLEH